MSWLNKRPAVTAEKFVADQIQTSRDDINRLVSFVNEAGLVLGSEIECSFFVFSCRPKAMELEGIPKQIVRKFAAASQVALEAEYGALFSEELANVAKLYAEAIDHDNTELSLGTSPIPLRHTVRLATERFSQDVRVSPPVLLVVPQLIVRYLEEYRKLRQFVI